MISDRFLPAPFMGRARQFLLTLIPLLLLCVASSPAHAQTAGSSCPTAGLTAVGQGGLLVCNSSNFWELSESWYGTSGYGYTLPNIGNDIGSCTAAKTGELIYTGSAWAYCNGSGTWTTFISYTNARSITISYSKVSTTNHTSLTNFPVLVSGTYSYLATTTYNGNINNTVTLNGQTVPADLLFTSDNACTSPLNWEVASYTASTGAIEAWVQVPTVSATANTVFYMCYGNSAINTYQGNATSAWDSYYQAVYHFANGSTLSLIDSTSNGNNGTNNGTTATSGEVDGGVALSGSSEYITIGDNSSLKITGALTIEAWVHPTNYSNYNGIVENTNGSPPRPL